jgi:hypothetical protein
MYKREVRKDLKLTARVDKYAKKTEFRNKQLTFRASKRLLHSLQNVSQAWISAEAGNTEKLQWLIGHGVVDAGALPLGTALSDAEKLCPKPTTTA